MVFEKLREIISEQLELSEELITMESNLMEDFDADSLDLVDLVMSVEDEFGVEVPEEAVENLKTVGDVVRFIEENK
jgi:acyl carrier protein